MIRKTFSLYALILIIGLTGCMARSDDFVASRLYLGLSNKDGEISQEDIRVFTDLEVTPRFPDGLTIYQTEGRWRSKDGTIGKERSVVIEIIHHGTAEDHARIEQIIDRYKARFRQESVLLVVTRPTVEFR
ncbi:hypothetical protein LBMAG53_15850 [Planctomycetota bacterium]|nr:hypothetical protein LBMAG53_15850 [Planctomycetota bacterium]